MLQFIIKAKWKKTTSWFPDSYCCSFCIRTILHIFPIYHPKVQINLQQTAVIPVTLIPPSKLHITVNIPHPQAFALAEPLPLMYYDLSTRFISLHSNIYSNTAFLAASSLAVSPPTKRLILQVSNNPFPFYYNFGLTLQWSFLILFSFTYLPSATAMWI